MKSESSPSRRWHISSTGPDRPLVAAARHDGHDVRASAAPFLALDDAGCRREEDPFTGEWTDVAPHRIVVSASRFEVDLNRDRAVAVYRTPDDAWGLNVWRKGHARFDLG